MPFFVPAVSKLIGTFTSMSFFTAPVCVDQPCIACRSVAILLFLVFGIAVIIAVITLQNKQLELKQYIRNKPQLSTKAVDIIFSITHLKKNNAALRGEQRDAPQFKPLCHNTKAKL